MQERGWSKRFGGLTGRLTALSLTNRADNGLPEGSQVISRGLGNWLSYLDWDNHRYSPALQLHVSAVQSTGCKFTLTSCKVICTRPQGPAELQNMDRKLLALHSASCGVLCRTHVTDGSGAHHVAPLHASPSGHAGMCGICLSISPDDLTQLLSACPFLST